jgi:hypothetical protein
MSLPSQRTGFGTTAPPSRRTPGLAAAVRAEPTIAARAPSQLKPTVPILDADAASEENPPAFFPR